MLAPPPFFFIIPFNPSHPILYTLTHTPMQPLALFISLLGYLLFASAATIPPPTEDTTEITDLLYLDIAQRTSNSKDVNSDDIDSTPFGTIIIGLFGTTVPKTVSNFMQLAPIYESTHTIFHRIIPGFVIQAGDIDGMGGHSAFGKKGATPPEGNGNEDEFGPYYSGLEDENFILKHDQAGRVSVANAGPNTGGSQFFITLGAQPHLDGHHVVFGQVMNGLDTTVAEIASVQRDVGDKPFLDVFINKAFATKYKRANQLELSAEEAQKDAETNVDVDGDSDSASEVGLDADPLKKIIPEVPINHPSEMEAPEKESEEKHSQENAKTQDDEAYAAEHPSELGGSRHHFVFLPFILIVGIVGLLTYKNKRNVMALIRGPRYRRITSVQS